MSRANSRAKTSSKRSSSGSPLKSEDQDGWTLLSHPSSASSSPDRDFEALPRMPLCSTPKRRRSSIEDGQCSRAGTSAISCETDPTKLDDGLTEINLRDNDGDHVNNSISLLKPTRCDDDDEEYSYDDDDDGSDGNESQLAETSSCGSGSNCSKAKESSSFGSKDFIDLQESSDNVDSELALAADKISYVGGRSLASQHSSVSSRGAESDSSEFVDETPVRLNLDLSRQGKMKAMLKIKRRRSSQLKAQLEQLARNSSDCSISEILSWAVHRYKRVRKTSKLDDKSDLGSAKFHLALSSLLVLILLYLRPDEEASNRKHIANSDISADDLVAAGSGHHLLFGSESSINLNLNQRQINELNRLHSELSQCIKRQSPSSFKYFRTDLTQTTEPYQPANRQRASNETLPTTAAGGRNATNARKPFRGLVCFGQEMRWRQKLARLEHDYGVNLRKFVTENKNQLASDLLESQHKGQANFKLILNQLEFSDLIQDKQIRRHDEELIKRLRAENQKLIRRLSEPQNTSCYKLLKSLELEKSKLTRENGALYERLMEKIGPTYIRQMTRLEECESDKHNLKQFQHKILEDVSRGYTAIDTQANLFQATNAIVADDSKSLEVQLAMTRRYLSRLHKKLDTLEAENVDLHEHLHSLRNKNSQMAVLLSETAPSRQSYENGPDTRRLEPTGANNSNALIADGCLQSFRELRNKSESLEAELARAKDDCKCNLKHHQAENFSVQRGPGSHLNVTQIAPPSLPPATGQPAIEWQQQQQVVPSPKRSVYSWSQSPGKPLVVIDRNANMAAPASRFPLAPPRPQPKWASCPQVEVKHQKHSYRHFNTNTQYNHNKQTEAPVARQTDATKKQMDSQQPQKQQQQDFLKLKDKTKQKASKQDKAIEKQRWFNFETKSLGGSSYQASVSFVYDTNSPLARIAKRLLLAVSRANN